MPYKVECVVAGAGCIGLAIARRLSRTREVLLMESCKTIGSQTSSRNSEVLHAGIYYKKGSLKARSCVEGVNKLYEYVKAKHIPHKMCGKLIVATSNEELPGLKLIMEKALSNGVTSLELISGQEAVAMEPVVHCIQALWSPTTGVFDSHMYMQSLLGDAEDNGACLVRECEVLRVDCSPGSSRFLVETSQGVVHCDMFINACGLHAQRLAREGMADIHPVDRVPELHYLKGSYFKYIGTSRAYAHASVTYYAGAKMPFSRLVYPLPDPATGALGMHATVDLTGAVRFGPDAEWVQEPGDLGVNEDRASFFEREIRRYYPGLPDNSLSPDYAGVRPRLLGPNSKAGRDKRALTDFLVEGPGCHGVAGLVNLYGIESPGLTSSLHIADYVEKLLVDS